MQSLTFVFLGYDFSAATLDSLCRSGHTLKKLFTWDVDGIYDTNENVVSIAKKYNADIAYLRITSDDIDDLANMGIDALICAGYPHKIPDNVQRFPISFNLHPSLLPLHKGPWPMPWHILNGDHEGAVSAHEITQDFDAGAIIYQKSFSLDKNDCHETICAKAALTSSSIANTILSHPELFIKRKPNEGGNYDLMPKPKHRTLNWEKNVEFNMRIVRAFGKFCSYAFIDNKKYLVADADGFEWEHDLVSGTVVPFYQNSILISVNDGFILLKQLTITVATASE